MDKIILQSLSRSKTIRNCYVMDRKLYEEIRDFILSSVGNHGSISLTDLIDKFSQQPTEMKAPDNYVYLLKVKRDLEARGIIGISFNGDRSQNIFIPKTRNFKSVKFLSENTLR